MIFLKIFQIVAVIPVIQRIWMKRLKRQSVKMFNKALLKGSRFFVNEYVDQIFELQ